MPIDCLCHSEDSRHLSWHIFVAEQQSDSVVATAWLKRWQRCKDTINGNLQPRFPSSSHLPAPLCPAMLAQHMLIHWWAGERMSLSMSPSMRTSSSPKCLWGWPPQCGKRTAVKELSTILIACRVKVLAGTKNLAQGMGSEHCRAETQCSPHGTQL